RGWTSRSTCGGAGGFAQQSGTGEADGSARSAGGPGESRGDGSARRGYPAHAGFAKTETRVRRSRMRQVLLGRPTVRFIPLPVERVRTPQYQHFRTPASLREVPFIPTPQHVVDAMLRAVGVNEKDKLYDLGCGDGRIVISAARDLAARAIG